jgi:hypothetical protein
MDMTGGWEYFANCEFLIARFTLEKIMYPFIFMFETLTIGTAVLMLGILMFREPEQNFRVALRSCLAWGAGFFLSMAAQIAVLAAI